MCRILPMNNAKSPQHSADTNQPSAESKGDSLKLDCRILLAEDTPSNQLLIAFLLRAAGTQVTVVEDGQKAVDLVLQQREMNHSFDVILMDMQMPVMDGYEATQRLREAGYQGPIIALTALAMMGDRQKCLNAGCDDYISKPIDRQALLQLVSKYAARRRSKEPQSPDCPISGHST
jgi:CheY-like chemotaxis protein